MISLLTLAGAVLLIPATAFAIYGIYRVVQYKAQVREALAKQIVEHRWNEVTEEQLNAMDLKIGQMCGPNKDILVEKNFNNIEGYNKVLQNDAKSIKLIEAFEMQQESMRTILELSEELDANTIYDTQTALGSIHESIDTLSTCKRTDLETVLPNEYNNFLDIQKNVKIISTKVSQILSTEAKNLVENNIIESSNMFDDLQNSTKEDAEDESKTDPSLEDKIMPEDMV
jgi:hypothetical protein